MCQCSQLSTSLIILTGLHIPLEKIRSQDFEFKITLVLDLALYWCDVMENSEYKSMWIIHITGGIENKSDANVIKLSQYWYLLLPVIVCCCVVTFWCVFASPLVSFHIPSLMCVLITPKGTSGFPCNHGFHQIRIPPPRGGFELNQASRTQNPISKKIVNNLYV